MSERRVVMYRNAAGQVEPAPEVLTASEVCDFLRIREVAANPARRLKDIRARYGLRAVPVGRERVYSLPNVLTTLARMTRGGAR